MRIGMWTELWTREPRLGPEPLSHQVMLDRAAASSVNWSTGSVVPKCRENMTAQEEEPGMKQLVHCPCSDYYFMPLPG